MKLSYHENTRLVYIRNDTPDELFLLGKLAAKLQCHVYQKETGVKEIMVELMDLLKLAAGDK